MKETYLSIHDFNEDISEPVTRESDKICPNSVYKFDPFDNGSMFGYLLKITKVIIVRGNTIKGI